MIAKIQSAGRSSKSAMAYNIDKVLRGVATVVSWRNLPDGNLMTAYSRFRELEENPAVSARTRAFGFHLTLNPGQEDEIRHREDRLIELADEVMAQMGYAEQPYIMIRHNDIEREHYHIVSIRVRPDGRSLSQPFEANKLMSFMQTIETKYGFKMGNPQVNQQGIDGNQGTRRTLTTSLDRFQPKRNTVIHQLSAIYEDALKWSFLDFQQFSAILESKGMSISMWQKKNGSGSNIVVKGIDYAGVVISRPFSLDRECGIDSLSLYNEAVKDKADLRSTTYSSMIRCYTVCEFALKKSHSMDEFRKVCHECGLWVSYLGGHSKGEITRLMIVDRKYLAVFDADELSAGLSVRVFNHLLEAGVWHEADEQEKEKIRKTKLVSPREISNLKQIIHNRLETDRGKPIDNSVGVRLTQEDGQSLSIKR